MNEMNLPTLETIPAKLEWLKHRYWKFGAEGRLDDHLLDLFEVDEEGHRTAAPLCDPLTDETRGLMVLGVSGNGKTSLLKRALRVDPVLTEFVIDQGGNTLFITVPPDATIKKLAEIILAKTGYTKVEAKLRSADAWEIALHRFELVGIRALVIDECHHIFRPGPGRDIPAAIQALKHIMQSHHHVALVIAGVPGLKTAILSEPTGETSRRFNEFRLSSIRPASKAAKTFRNNFETCARVLNLRFEEGTDIPERILFAKRGQVGESVKLGKEILRGAIIRKHNMVSLEGAKQIFLKSEPTTGITPFEATEWDMLKVEMEVIGWGQ